MNWWWQELLVRAKFTVAREILILAGLIVAAFALTVLSFEIGLYIHFPWLWLLLGLYLLRWVVWAIRIEKERRRSVPFDRETRCRKCGYILRGIPEPRCSECGERI